MPSKSPNATLPSSPWMRLALSGLSVPPMLRKMSAYWLVPTRPAMARSSHPSWLMSAQASELDVTEPGSAVNVGTNVLPVYAQMSV